MEFLRKRDVLSVRVEQKYACQYCGSGAPSWGEVFARGTCRNCGAGAEEVDVSYVERKFPELERSVFLVYANDTREAIEEIRQRMVDEFGIRVVTLEDLLPNGVFKEDVPRILSEATRRVPFVFYVPSPELEGTREGDLVSGTLLAESYYQEKDGFSPIYTSADQAEYLPPHMVVRAGICLSGEDMGHGVFNTEVFWERWLPDIKRRIGGGE